jgi:hypothetical protein
MNSLEQPDALKRQVRGVRIPFRHVVFAEDISGADLAGADRDIRHAGNPLSSTALASRELFGNPGGDDDSWIAQNAILMAIVWPTLIIATFEPLAVRRYCYVSR